jgi:hypothetical protein
MIRGLVPKERLLEWYVGDGWQPLCEFLDKPVPEVEFPHVNAMNEGWKQREKQAAQKWVGSAFRNLFAMCGVLVAAAVAGYSYW